MALARITFVFLVSFSALSFSKTCAAMRGNGEQMLAHFGALAHLTEAYGRFEAMAGGSSASVSTFLYESMLLNPALSNCAGKECSKEAQTRHLALLLKSVPETLEAIRKGPEALAVRDLKRLREDIKANGIDTLFRLGKLRQGAHALWALLTNKELRKLINPEILHLIVHGRAKEVLDQIMRTGQFKADNTAIFLRPGVLNFRSAPYTFGKMADFYAGRGPVNSNFFYKFFIECAGAENKGKDWYSLNTYCRESIREEFSRYRQKYDKVRVRNPRRKDIIGENLSVLITTSVLTGEDAQTWREARKAYLTSREMHPDIPFNPSFENLKFGYWGRANDLEKVERRVINGNDAKGKKFLSLGEARWETALRTSPAEPGLTNGQAISKTQISLGGWSDLHPVLALEALGCDEVVYVTRRGPESKFAVRVAYLLGMSAQEEEELYSLDSLSSYKKALQTADAIWCTDWNNKKFTDFTVSTQDAYYAPVLIRSEFFRGASYGLPNPQLNGAELEGCY